MSDFLTNLVGRALGSVEVVRPRVPSLFEPHRQGTGLLAARPSLPMRHADPARDAASEGEVTAPPVHPRSQPLRPPAVNPAAPDRQAPEAEPTTQPTDGFELPHPAGPTPPAIAPSAVVRPGPIAAIQVPDRSSIKAEPDSHPAPRPATRDPIRPAAKERPDAPSVTAIPSTPVDWRESRPKEIQPLAQSTQVKAKPEPPTSAPDTKPEISTIRPNRAQSATPPATAMPSLVAHRPLQDTRGIRPPIVPRPAARNGGAKDEGASPASSSPKPQIEVSIGKVEVRAVFPEQPARRTPQARPRPTVSLDDYLNRRHGGKR
jgi:hypothetical protein